jgi:PAS domain S-box-containing protein
LPHTLTETNKAAFLSKLNRAFWLGTGAVAGVGLTFALLSWLNHRSVSLVLESQIVGRLARESRALAVERETSIRGYLLTHREMALATERAARNPLDAKLDSLVRLSADNASQRDRAITIRSAIRRWERGWAFPALDPSNGAPSQNPRDSLAGKELFDSIRGAFESFLNGHQRIFNSRVRALGFLQQFSFIAILVEGALLFGVLVWLRRRAFNQASLLLEQQSQLQAQSLDLQTQAAELEEQAVELEEQADEANRAANALAEINENLEKTVKRLEAAESTAETAKSHGDVIEGLLNVLLENAPVGVVLYDSRKRIVRVNPALETMTGMKNADHVGKAADDLSTEEIAETVDSILSDVLSSGSPVMNVPLSGANKVEPAKERHFLCSYFPVMLPGRQKGVGGVIVETTQFRQLEEQLLQSQKMEAVGRLAGGVAHDFNNMLTAIMSYSDLILADMPPESPLRSDMVEIVKAAEKATALTRKLLAFSRQQVLRPALVDMNATIEGLRKMIKRLIGPAIELSVQPGEGLWTVSADPTEIERVLMNLVLNARDAMADGGKLIVETSNIVIDQEYSSAHAETSPGDYVMVAITDTGAGMTREVREKLFEPFFTTKEKGKGTGLGLPSVYGIVKQSGGFVWVYSELGKGTTFKIYLPRATDLAARENNAPQRVRRIGAETILLVEDDDEVRQVASRILRRNGYRVLEAENGADALRVCESENEPVDLIVTDLVMPEMGGSELAKKIREHRPDARILFTSGYTEDAVVRQSLLHDGEAFIEKPFTPARLANKAREMLSTEDDLD